MTKFKIELGAKVKDEVTGIEGIVIGRTEHITGCNTYSVQPRNKKEPHVLVEILGFDEGRLTVEKIAIKPEKVQGKDKGADMRTPRSTKGH